MTDEARAAKELCDTDGENRAVRMFLMMYGAQSCQIDKMRKHMELGGFPFWPEWVSGAEGHLTKAGAQSWIRYLFALEPQAGASMGVPEGLVLVPIEPTDKMLDALCDRMWRDHTVWSVWKAMLAASPAPKDAPTCKHCDDTKVLVVPEIEQDDGVVPEQEIVCPWCAPEVKSTDSLCGPTSQSGTATLPDCGMLPERDPTRRAEDQGVFRKFEVARTDGSSEPGKKHENCEYFVLDIDHDPHAQDALYAYALSCRHTHPQLSKDMYERYDLIPPASAPVGTEPQRPDQIEEPAVGVREAAVCEHDYKSTYEGMDGERYRCSKCGDSYFLDYEDMK